MVVESNNSDGTNEKWTFRLYIAGQSRKSSTALANLTRLCEQHMDPDTYEIEVIDLLENPQLAVSDQIIAIPTLVRVAPEPIKKIIGDLSLDAKVEAFLTAY